jgi:hypothetical protein
MTKWGWYWLLWLVIGFGVPETIGLLQNVKNTLSWQIWGLEHINFSDPLNLSQWPCIHWALAILLFAFITWLGVHLIFGIWR